MSIRWRLTIWFSLVLCLILIVTGVSLYLALQRYLDNEVDSDLKAQSARLHGSLGTDEVQADFEVIHSMMPPINEFASPGIYIQLVDRDGVAVLKSENLGQQELPVNPALLESAFTGQARISTVSAGDGVMVRVMVSPLYLKDQTLVLEVARSLRHSEVLMSRVRWSLLGGAFLALGLAVLSGLIVARRALAPVERIAQTARDIEASNDLSRRVGYRGPADEVGRLAMTFDRMIGHLDRGFKAQKDFVADASHELRTPLTVLRGNLDLLKRNMSEEDRRESLRAMEKELGRMGRIVGDLLLLMEVESGPETDREPVALLPILLEKAEWAQRIAPDREVTLAEQEDLAVPGDPYKLAQVVANLVENAVKYTFPGDRVTLSLRREGEWACLDIADSGPGIPQEHLPHIFDRFYRVDKARSRASGGSGLGLAIVKGIVERHGGKVEVTSAVGRGSTFTVFLRL